MVTPAAAALGVVEQCARLGIKRVWLHRSLYGGSTSPEAMLYCRLASISVIPGACPMMFCEPVDFWHRCMRWILGKIAARSTCKVGEVEGGQEGCIERVMRRAFREVHGADMPTARPVPFGMEPAPPIA